MSGRGVFTQAPTDGELIGVGHSTFRLPGGRLRQFVDEGEVTVAARDLLVTAAGGKRLVVRAHRIPRGPMVGDR
jgi:hypothetical protein